MNWTEILEQAIVGFLYLLLQSFLMNGIKISSEGRNELKPDGSMLYSEMIFARVAAYLNQHDIDIVYYKNNLFHELLNSIAVQYPSLQIKDARDNYIFVDEPQLALWKKLQRQIENTFDIKLNLNINSITIYREYKQYRFSKYIRKPIFGCIVCMPSFWGIFTCLIPAIVVMGFQWWTLPFYIINGFCCAFLNYKIYKPL